MRIEYHCIRIVYRKWIFSIWLSCHKSIFFLDFFGLKIQNARASKKRKKKLWKKPKRKQQANKLMVLSPRKAIGSENSTNKTMFAATKICQIFFFYNVSILLIHEFRFVLFFGWQREKDRLAWNRLLFPLMISLVTLKYATWKPIEFHWRIENCILWTAKSCNFCFFSFRLISFS